MTMPDRRDALDHVVVLMFENRSFDNLLGRLYEPGEVSVVRGRDRQGPQQPDPGVGRARRGPRRRALRRRQGHEHAVSRPRRGVPAHQHAVVRRRSIRPATAACPPSRWSRRTTRRPTPIRCPTMDGFVTDYISAFTAEMGRQPTYDEYSQIMAGYTPEQMPVLSTLARGFATSTTGSRRCRRRRSPTARSFTPRPRRAWSSTPRTRTSRCTTPPRRSFDRLEAHGLSWRVYCDPPSRYSLTGVIHAPRLRERFATHFFSTDQFFEDAERGELPTYAFIEPQIIGHAHNDMHPAFGMLTPGLNFDPPSSLIGGEDLLARIYNAIRSASSPDRVELPQHPVHGRLRRTRRHLRPRPAAGRRPTRPDRTGRADGLRVRPARRPAARRSPSRRGSPRRPSSTTPTATPR